jgi:hypothetical protein
MISPFERIVVFDYYDGPTSGFAKCARGSTAYRFELAAWDSYQDNRIFSLAEMDSTKFDSIVEILSRFEKPRWPVWMPRYQINLPTEEELVSDALDRTLATLPAASLLIATDHLDKTIMRCRSIEASVRDQVPPECWSPSDPKKWRLLAEYIGLVRPSRKRKKGTA